MFSYIAKGSDEAAEPGKKKADEETPNDTKEIHEEASLPEPTLEEPVKPTSDTPTYRQVLPKLPNAFNLKPPPNAVPVALTPEEEETWIKPLLLLGSWHISQIPHNRVLHRTFEFPSPGMLQDWVNKMLAHMRMTGHYAYISIRFKRARFRTTTGRVGVTPDSHNTSGLSVRDVKLSYYAERAFVAVLRSGATSSKSPRNGEKAHKTTPHRSSIEGEDEL